MDMNTWSGDGTVIAFKDADNAAKCVLLVQSVIAAERERCAKIAEGMWSPESNSKGFEYILRHQIAADIRIGK